MEFQPSTSKIRVLTNSIVAMTAGDATLQAEIFAFVGAEIAAAIQSNPARWLTVREVADRYSFHWVDTKRRRAEQQILRPLGLTSERLLAEAASMNPATFQFLSNGVLSFALPSSSCLIVGIDETGPHIYVVYDGQAVLADRVGFAAIGIGSRHADSQLMVAQYAPDISVSASLALIHLAKKRAEAAPGVGSETDMFVIGPGLGTYMPLLSPIMNYLNGQAEKMRREEAEALVAAQDGMREFIQSFGKAPEPQEAEPSQVQSEREEP